MKVLIINLDKSIFSSGSKSLERLKEYAGFCERLSVIVLTRQIFEPIITANLSVYATGSCRRLKYLFDALRLAKKIMAKDKYDLVMTQDPFDTGFIGWLIKKKHKIPWQCQAHTDFLSPYFWRESLSNKFRVLLAKFLLPKADGIRVVSQRIMNSIISKYRHIAISKITVLPIFADLEKIGELSAKDDLKIKYAQFDFIILIASRLSKEKNIDLAISAMAEIIKQYPKTGLVIVGSGSEKAKLQLKTKNYQLQANIIFEPWRDDLTSYYKSADLFLLVSNYEGWGMTVIEAANFSLPIIMTDVGCAGEIIKNGESGIIIDVGDKNALTEAIIKLIRDKNFAKKLGEEAKKAISSLPGREQYLGLYKKSFQAVSESSIQ